MTTATLSTAAWLEMRMPAPSSWMRTRAWSARFIWRATGDRDAVEDLAQETFLRVFRGLRYFAALPLDRLPVSGELDPEAAAARAQTDRIVREGLLQLPEKYRLPLVYAAIDGLDYATIASMLDVPLGTVKTLVFRAKQMLRNGIAPAFQARTVRGKASDAR